MKAFAVEAARLCADRRCDDVVVFDVRGQSQVCDYIIVASGTSDRQMRSVAQELKELGREHDHPVFRTSADDGGTWIVADCVDVVVHLFEPDQRLYYDIESLWMTAPRVPWKRPEDALPPAKIGARSAGRGKAAAAE
ncbi:MAG TPA: ribosome silencing factor [Phycisphaerales bacterium]|nr:ribosome silencing factor [Phycisphaerales bacterium]HMP38292.1 ribosome silencing factor [Phycisphaerales bacterium]